MHKQGQPVGYQATTGHNTCKEKLGVQPDPHRASITDRRNQCTLFFSAYGAFVLDEDFVLTRGTLSLSGAGLIVTVLAEKSLGISAVAP
jgi:hypothetical protein